MITVLDFLVFAQCKVQSLVLIVVIWVLVRNVSDTNHRVYFILASIQIAMNSRQAGMS